jgi:DNA polymerase I
MPETVAVERPKAESRADYELIDDTSRLAEIAPELESSRTVGVDTEGNSLDPFNAKLLLLQLSTPTKTFVIDLVKVKDLSPIKPMLESPKPLKIIQNAKFDYSMLKIQLGITVSGIYDTMIAERLLTNGVGREISLRAIAKKYLGLTLDKTIRETFTDPKSLAGFGRFNKEQLAYAARDAQILHQIFSRQLKKLQENELMDVAKLEFTLTPVVADMELHGVLIDTHKWREHIANMQLERDRINQEIQIDLKPLSKHVQVDLFGAEDDVINLDSPSQLLDAFQKLGVNVTSTGEAVLKTVDHPLAKKILDYRGYEKLISAFGESLLSKINPVTGRLHPDFLQLGADTGRFACSNPNLQQIPQDASFRNCFIASPGYKMITADYSQIELRIMAEFSQDPTFLKAFSEDADLHMMTATNMFKVKPEDVDKRMRTAAKTINFGLMYGRGPGSIAVQIGSTIEEAKELLDIYFKSYTGVKKWLDKAGQDALKLGYAKSRSGRRRWFERPDKDHPDYLKIAGSIERQGKNMPIQGTNADITKYALIYISERFKKEGWDAHLTHTVHDEIVAEVPAELVEEGAKAVEDEMIRAANKLLGTVSTKVDVHTADYWEK